MSLDNLQRRVALEYDRLGLPSWPDPRPDGAEAREEEYSRVTDPDKYRVTHGRARAWVTTLASVPGVRVEELGAVDGVMQAPSDRPGAFDRATRLTSDRPGTLPLVHMERDGGPSERGPLVDVLQIAVGDPPFAVEMQPDCGCDACDFGSAGLLENVDETIRTIVGGPFVAVRGRRWSATWHPGGGGMSSSQHALDDFTTVMAACRRLADGEDARLRGQYTAHVGHAWMA